MAITEHASGTQTVSTTEWSLTTSTAGPDVDATDGVFQAWLDLSALAAGDLFEFRVYEKVISGGTQRLVYTVPFANAQGSPHWVSPSLILMHGWDFTIIKISGTNRSINYSVRKIA